MKRYKCATIIILGLLLALGFGISSCIDSKCHCEGVTIIEKLPRQGRSLLDFMAVPKRDASAALKVDANRGTAQCLVQYLSSHRRRVVTIDIKGDVIDGAWSKVFETAFNAINVRISGSQIDGRFEETAFTGCSYHTLSLEVKSICSSFVKALVRIRRVEMLRMTGVAEGHSLVDLIRELNVGSVEFVDMSVDNSTLDAAFSNPKIQSICFELSSMSRKRLSELTIKRPDMVIKFRGSER